MRQIWFSALIAGLMVMTAQAAQAAVQTIDVTVEMTGDSPEDARAKALDYVKKRAFYLMLTKTAPEQADEIVKTMTTEQMYQHIRGLELLQDLQNGNHYLGKYRVSVSEDMVERLQVSEDPGVAKANPTLVIPVLKDNGQTLLWEGSNLWRSLWNSTALERGEGILVVPYGDPNDQGLTNGSTILSYNYAALEPMAKRYGAGEIVVVLAEYDMGEPQGVNVTMRRMAPGFDKIKDMFFEVDSQHETPQALLVEAARSVADQVKDVAKNYQGEQERRIADASKQKLVAQFRRLNDWVQIQERLKKLPRVVQFDVDVINIESATATLYYDGTAELMQQTMLAQGLHVEPLGDSWNISLR